MKNGAGMKLLALYVAMTVLAVLFSACIELRPREGIPEKVTLVIETGSDVCEGYNESTCGAFAKDKRMTVQNYICTGYNGPAETTKTECVACPNGNCNAGATCIVDSDCAGGAVCTPDGKCVPPVSCTSDSNCPAGTGSICANGRCIVNKPCTSSKDCIEGSVCTAGRCVLENRCVSAADCLYGAVCANGQCIAPRYVSCAKSTDCATGSACHISQIAGGAIEYNLKVSEGWKCTQEETDIPRAGKEMYDAQGVTTPYVLEGTTSRAAQTEFKYSTEVHGLQSVTFDCIFSYGAMTDRRAWVYVYAMFGSAFRDLSPGEIGGCDPWLRYSTTTRFALTQPILLLRPGRDIANSTFKLDWNGISCACCPKHSESFLQASYSVSCVPKGLYKMKWKCVNFNRVGAASFRFVNCSEGDSLKTFQGGQTVLLDKIPYSELGGIVTSFYSGRVNESRQVPFFMIGQGPTFDDYEEAKAQCTPFREKLVNISLGNTTFDPPELTVAPTSQICIENKDSVSHRLDMTLKSNGKVVNKFSIASHDKKCVPSVIGDYTLNDSNGDYADLTVAGDTKIAQYYVGSRMTPNYGVVDLGGIVNFSRTDLMPHSINASFLMPPDTPFSFGTAFYKTWTTNATGEFLIRDNATNQTSKLFVQSPGNLFTFMSDGSVTPSDGFLARPLGDTVCFASQSDGLMIDIYRETEDGPDLLEANKSVSTYPSRCCVLGILPGNYSGFTSDGRNVTWFIGSGKPLTTITLQKIGFVPDVLDSSPGTRTCWINPSAKERSIETLFTEGGSISLFHAPKVPALSNNTCGPRADTVGAYVTGFIDPPVKPKQVLNIKKTVDYSIKVLAYGFSPNDIAAQPGDNICWVNTDTNAHFLTTETGAIIRLDPKAVDCVNNLPRDKYYYARTLDNRNITSVVTAVDGSGFVVTPFGVGPRSAVLERSIREPTETTGEIGEPIIKQFTVFNTLGKQAEFISEGGITLRKDIVGISQNNTFMQTLSSVSPILITIGNTDTSSHTVEIYDGDVKREDIVVAGRGSANVTFAQSGTIVDRTLANTLALSVGAEAARRNATTSILVAAQPLQFVAANSKVVINAPYEYSGIILLEKTTNSRSAVSFMDPIPGEPTNPVANQTMDLPTQKISGPPSSDMLEKMRKYANEGVMPAIVPSFRNVTVTISTSAFKPNDVNVSPGSTVVWKNIDTVPHTITIVKNAKKLDCQMTDPIRDAGVVSCRYSEATQTCDAKLTDVTRVCSYVYEEPNCKTRDQYRGKVTCALDTESGNCSFTGNTGATASICGGGCVPKTSDLDSSLTCSMRSSGTGCAFSYKDPSGIGSTTVTNALCKVNSVGGETTCGQQLQFGQPVYPDIGCVNGSAGDNKCYYTPSPLFGSTTGSTKFDNRFCTVYGRVESRYEGSSSCVCSNGKVPLPGSSCSSGTYCSNHPTVGGECFYMCDGSASWCISKGCGAGGGCGLYCPYDIVMSCSLKKGDSTVTPFSSSCELTPKGSSNTDAAYCQYNSTASPFNCSTPDNCPCMKCSSILSAPNIRCERKSGDCLLSTEFALDGDNVPGGPYCTYVAANTNVITAAIAPRYADFGNCTFGSLILNSVYTPDPTEKLCKAIIETEEDIIVRTLLPNENYTESNVTKGTTYTATDERSSIASHVTVVAKDANVTVGFSAIDPVLAEIAPQGKIRFRNYDNSTAYNITATSITAQGTTVESLTAPVYGIIPMQPGSVIWNSGGEGQTLFSIGSGAASVGTAKVIVSAAPSTFNVTLTDSGFDTQSIAVGIGSEVCLDSDRPRKIQISQQSNNKVVQETTVVPTSGFIDPVGTCSRTYNCMAPKGMEDKIECTGTISSTNEYCSYTVSDPDTGCVFDKTTVCASVNPDMVCAYDSNRDVCQFMANTSRKNDLCGTSCTVKDTDIAGDITCQGMPSAQYSCGFSYNTARFADGLGFTTTTNSICRTTLTPNGQNGYTMLCDQTGRYPDVGCAGGTPGDNVTPGDNKCYYTPSPNLGSTQGMITVMLPTYTTKTKSAPPPGCGIAQIGMGPMGGNPGPCRTSNLYIDHTQTVKIYGQPSDIAVCVAQHYSAGEGVGWSCNYNVYPGSVTLEGGYYYSFWAGWGFTVEYSVQDYVQGYGAVRDNQFCNADPEYAQWELHGGLCCLAVGCVCPRWWAWTYYAQGCKLNTGGSTVVPFPSTCTGVNNYYCISTTSPGPYGCSSAGNCPCLKCGSKYPAYIDCTPKAGECLMSSSLLDDDGSFCTKAFDNACVANPAYDGVVCTGPTGGKCDIYSSPVEDTAGKVCVLTGGSCETNLAGVSCSLDPSTDRCAAESTGEKFCFSPGEGSYTIKDLATNKAMKIKGYVKSDRLDINLMNAYVQPVSVSTSPGSDVCFKSVDGKSHTFAMPIGVNGGQDFTVPSSGLACMKFPYSSTAPWTIRLKDKPSAGLEISSLTTDVTIKVKYSVFEPDSVIVRPNSTVMFVNKDQMSHSLLSGLAASGLSNYNITGIAETLSCTDCSSSRFTTGSLLSHTDKTDCIGDIDCGVGFCSQEKTCRPYKECGTMLDCPEGSACVSGRCASSAACSTDRDCKATESCSSGICSTWKPLNCTITECPIGSACASDNVCKPLKPCMSSSECPAGTSCTDSQGCPGPNCILGKCAAQITCSVSATCPSGSECRGGVCSTVTPTCASSIDCPSGSVCAGGVCSPASNCSPGICPTNFICSNSKCLSPLTCPSGIGCPAKTSCSGGECVNDTGTACTATSCPAGLSCSADGRCKPPQSCAQQSDCPSGSGCLNGVCSKSTPCVGGACPAGSACSAGNICTTMALKKCAKNGDCDTVAPGNCNRTSDCQLGFVCSEQCPIEQQLEGRCEGLGTCHKSPIALCSVDGVCKPSVSCSSSSQCSKGYGCLSGACVAQVGCTLSSECPSDSACVQGECVRKTTACLLDSDCINGSKCSMDGNCIPITNCTKSSECALVQPGSSCRLNGSFCEGSPACISPSDCETGSCVSGGCTIPFESTCGDQSFGTIVRDSNSTFTLPLSTQSMTLYYEFKDNGRISVNGHDIVTTTRNRCTGGTGSYSYAKTTVPLEFLNLGGTNNLSMTICSCGNGVGSRISVSYKYLPTSVGQGTLAVFVPGAKGGKPGVAEKWFSVDDKGDLTYVDAELLKSLSISVKDCEGQDIVPIASTIGGYERPDYKTPECDTGAAPDCKVYNPYGPATVAFLTTEQDLDLTKEEDFKCAASQINAASEACPSCTLALFVGKANNETLKGILQNMNSTEQYALTKLDTIAQSGLVNDYPTCSIADFMNEKANASKLALYDYKKTSVILDFGIKTGSNTAGTCNWTDKSIIEAYDDTYGLWIPILAGSGTVGVSQHCYSDPCLQRDFYGLINEEGAEKPYMGTWFREGCGRYYFNGEGLSLTTFAMNETNYSFCDPSRILAVLQTAECGIGKKTLKSIQ